MTGSFAEISPALSSDHADDALGHAVVAMRPGWVALRGCVLDTGDAPVRVRYALLHPQVGIALLDVVPGQTTPNAADHLRRKLDAAAFHAEFGCTPPILYLCIPVRVLPDAGHLLEYEFSRQPASPLPRGDGWVTAAQAILSAQPLGPAQQLAGRGRQPARRFGGARPLAGFWGFAILTAGGGALYLQYLGPPGQAAQAVAMPSMTKAEASGPAGADLQRTLLENDQAILALQNRLNGPRPDPERGPGSAMVANAVLTSTVPSGAAAGRGVSTAAQTQVLADLSEEIDATPAQVVETAQPPAQDAAARSADLARAEAALQQLRADAEATQRRLADMNTQVERAGQQVTAAEQQLAALQHQSEDVQTAGAAAGKQLTDAQAQLSGLEERRSAAEQQLRSLQAQADRTQGDHAAVEQQVAAGKAQLALITEQQAATLAAQAAAPAEAAPAALEHAEGAVPVSVPHDSAAVKAAPFPALSWPDRAPDPASAALAETMVRRGDALLQYGDVSAARLLYERAASTGSARAATAMGKTFDATVLAGIGAVGLSPDPALAALWYRRGLSLGDEEAGTRLQPLPPAASHTAAWAERP
jgi:predicted  nucleic acid-binding Zn-ribbon protein